MSMRKRTPPAWAISEAWPSSPKPVISVQARTPAHLSTREAGPLRRSIESTAPWRWAGWARSFLAAVVITPVPMRLVRMRRSPGRAPPFDIICAGSARPVTQRPYFGSGVGDGVPARDHAARFAHFVPSPLEDSGQDRLVQVGREGHDIQGKRHLATHRVHVAHRVGGGYRPEGVRVVHDRREEVERLDERLPLVDEVDSGVIAGRRPIIKLGCV